MKNRGEDSIEPESTGPILAQGPASWTETLLGVVLFLVLGALLIVEEIPVDWIAPERIPFRLALIWACVLAPPLGLAIGWIKGFPRWTFAYFGAIILSYYLARAYTPYLTLFGAPVFGSEQQGWRAWIPLLLACVIGLLVTRSFRSLSLLASRVNRDLTLITYAMFGLMPFLIAISFDEIDRLYSLPWVAGLVLLLIGIAIAYLRSRDMRGRLATLSSGILLSLTLMVVGPTLYQVGWVDLPGMIFDATIIAVIMLVPVFFALAQTPEGVGKV